MKYRPEIDGLRAIVDIPVILVRIHFAWICILLSQVDDFSQSLIAVRLLASN